MRLVLAAAASVALALPAFAQTLDIPAGTYVADKTHTSVVWKVSHLGYSDYTAMFERGGIDATVQLDPANVANSTLEVTVNGQGVATLHPIEADPRGVDFNAEIESAQILNTAQFPEIRFTSTAIEVTGEDTATITGDLKIGEQTHPMTLEAKLNAAGVHPVTNLPTLGVSATGVVERTQYGINFLAGPVGTNVTVEIQAEFVQQQQ